MPWIFSEGSVSLATAESEVSVETEWIDCGGDQPMGHARMIRAGRRGYVVEEFEKAGLNAATD